MAINQTDICTFCGARNYGQYVLNNFFCATCLYNRYQQCQDLAKRRIARHQQQQLRSYFNYIYNPYQGPIFHNKTQANWGGDLEVPEIKFSNGDTEEWTKLEIKGLAKSDFDQVLGIIKLAIASSDKNWDSKRNCWFIRTSLVDTLIIGFQSLVESINKASLAKGYGFRGIVIEDKREKYESFDEFFNVPPPMSGSIPKSKQDLIKALEHHLKSNELFISIREDIDLDSAKKLYRKAALAFHPDRNNGDGSKMSELNMIWNDLQKRF